MHSFLSLLRDRRIMFVALSVLCLKEMLSYKMSSSVMGAVTVCGEVIRWKCKISRDAENLTKCKGLALWAW